MAVQSEGGVRRWIVRLRIIAVGNYMSNCLFRFFGTDTVGTAHSITIAENITIKTFIATYKVIFFIWQGGNTINC